MKQLKELRIAANLTQAEVAKVFKYATPQFVSNWERGISHPPLGSIRKLAELYKVNESEIASLLWQHDIKSINFKYKRWMKACQMKQEMQF